MRSPSLRHVIHLTLTLADQSSPLWREIAVDRELTLADLNRIVTGILGGPQCGHHLFADDVTGPDRMYSSRRRWGDRWTMIDFRDPTVIDEATARIGATLARAGTLFLTHTCDARWVVAIKAGVDDIVSAAEPPARVIAGEGRSPLPCSRSEYEHTVLVGTLDDPEHPDHAAFRDHLAWLRGPWADDETAAFDAMSAQESLDDLFGSSPSPEGPVLSFVSQLPRIAQSSARTHVAAAGLDLPTVVTADEIDEFVRLLRWIVRRAGAGGIPIHAGEVDGSFVTDAATVLAIDEHRLREAVAAAKRLHLLYSRHGHLLAKRSVLEEAGDASRFWSVLAASLTQGGSLAASPEACQLLLLAMADGSLSDPAVGTRDISHAYDLMSATRVAAQSYTYYYDGVDGECGARCRCPASPVGTWHDLVTTTVRKAAEAASADGASTVISSVAAYRPDVPSDWTHGARPECDGYDVTPFATRRERRVAEDEPRRLLDDLGALTEVLSVLGLERDDHGSWIVPPTLREFARAALGARAARQHRTNVYDPVQYGAW